MTVLNKRIRKSDSRRIVRARIINGIIEGKEIRYIWWIIIRLNINIYYLFLRMGFTPALITKTN